jgi:hypothetical protein
MRTATLYFNGSRNVWTHDDSGHSFINWDDDASYERIAANAHTALKEYYSLRGMHGDFRVVFKDAPNRQPPAPVAVQMTNFTNPMTSLNDDADPAATRSYNPKDMKPPPRNSVA